ncbi:DDRGK domain-containing protein 1 isoform X1 [Rhipicephalus sanguineus]|uniref:DDRGK domain-containing protein 1 isoform X1 n=1 Tax=Rhipicephalus sanguineus TaxID=34632 RepID=UPI0020C222EC|nr:DDRGK domain-containing protein 1 isoform X1 [Rhipicephalus sanguineus]
MSDLIMILTGAISLVTIILIGLLVWRGSTSSDKEPQVRAVPINREGGAPAGIRRPRRNVRARMGAGRQLNEGKDDDEDEEMLEDMVAMPEGKIGAKKRKKLEMKAEKRAQRERDLEDREERRQKQALDEERRKQEEQREKELEAEREAEEKRLKEEKEKQELEEYLKLKEAFSVEGEGFDAATEEEAQNKLQEFLDHIKKEKVVILEDLAAKFQLKTQECIDRVQALLADETLVGVIDDRGKFIYITRQELEEVAHFIRQRGRVSISELVDSSNSLINLTPAA